MKFLISIFEYGGSNIEKENKKRIGLSGDILDIVADFWSCPKLR